MARETHYQSVGNPVQLDRLPVRRTELALPYLPYKPAEDAKFVRRRLVWLLWLAFAAALGRVLVLGLSARGLLWMFAAALPLAMILWFVTRTSSLLRCRDLPLVASVLVAAFVLLTIPLPLTILFFCGTCVTGAMTWLIGWHWLERCLTTPLDIVTAARLRNSLMPYLALAALVPLLALMATVVFPLKLVMLSVSSFILLQLAAVLWQQRSLTRLRVLWQAFVSWIAYDRHDLALPGTLSSPAGSYVVRFAITGSAVAINSTVSASLLMAIQTVIVPTGSTAASVNIPGSMILALLTLKLTAFATLVLPMLLAAPLLAEADRYRDTEIKHENWKSVIKLLLYSSDPVERQSLYMGRMAHDGSPLLVPRSIFCEHAHFLGDSGGGKTSLGLAPLVEGLGSAGDCSIVLIDLKADSMEMLGTLLATAEQAEKRTGSKIPVKHFSNQHTRSTFAFNPLENPQWHGLDLYTRTDILCGALGLEYGADYGEGYYSSANAAVLYAAIRAFPETCSFRELAEHVALVSSNAKRFGLHSEIAKAGSHVHTVLHRLGSFDALNITADSAVPPDVREKAVDFRTVFEQPQFLYFHLSATLAPGSAPEIARLAAYSLLAAATQTKRNRQVYLVVDEFQRMIARNLEYMLQLARSMGVGVIIANQAMEDLRKSSLNLIPPIESNCRYRQWFSISSLEDRQRLVQSSGETVDLLISKTSTSSSRGGTSTSIGTQESVTPRLTSTDILLASDHPKQSIVRISRSDGYAQYGGMPFVLEANFHIDEAEYQRRKETPWPANIKGSFVPSTAASPNARTTAGGQRRGKIDITTEVIGACGQSSAAKGSW